MDITSQHDYEDYLEATHFENIILNTEAYSEYEDYIETIYFCDDIRTPNILEESILLIDKAPDINTSLTEPPKHDNTPYYKTIYH